VAGNLDEFEEKDTRGNIRQCHEMAFRGNMNLSAMKA
jgi:hypothetical protein